MSVDYQRHDTGLVLVDPYNDFLSKDGKIWPRIRAVAESVELARHLRELLGAMRSAGLPIVIAPRRRWRPGDLDGWLRLAPSHTAIRDIRAFEFGTTGGEFHPEFGPREGDHVSFEHWSPNGFVGTDLDLLLRQRGIDNIVLAGLTAPGCVEGTARMAVALGYAVTLVRDATAAFTDELMHAAHDLTGPLYANAILTTDEVIAALPN